MARKVVTALALLAIVVVAAGGPIDALETRPEAGGGQPGSWIVTLGEGSDPAAEAPGLARRHGGSVGHVYQHALRGFQFHGSEQAAANLARHPRVERVEADGIATIVHHRPGHDGGPGGGGGDDGETAPDPDPIDPRSCPGDEGGQHRPWGIERIGAVTSHDGGVCVEVEGVRAYVIDSGVDSNHPDLDVVAHRNFASGPNRDCNGHGTHVAGTIAAIDDDADVVGVAPGAQVVGVRVLNCAGSGTWSGVIAGIDWVANDAAGRRAVANLSLGGGASSAVDTAVMNLANSGVTVAVAAGNSGANACNYSPARAGTHAGVITVAATNSGDAETSWSNWGTCVDLWAPGAGIVSTAVGGGTTTMSGTSMAAPHVAGAGALRLSSADATAAQIEAGLKASAEPLTTRSKSGSPIVLLSAA